MALSLFQPFARMIDGLPAHAVCRAVELECRMLSDDLACHRDEPQDEVFSIECFHLFLQAAKDGRRMAATYYLSDEQFDFYRKTVERLIAASELPPDALKHFDGMFFTAAGSKGGVPSLLTSLSLPHRPAL